MYRRLILSKYDSHSKVTKIVKLLYLVYLKTEMLIWDERWFCLCFDKVSNLEEEEGATTARFRC